VSRVPDIPFFYSGYQSSMSEHRVLQVSRFDARPRGEAGKFRTILYSPLLQRKKGSKLCFASIISKSKYA
jgi:hypothetical protein